MVCHKIVCNSMYEYIIIKMYSKCDTATNMAAFPITHCILLATNELNNASNSSRRVGGEVVFFLRPRQAMSGLPMLSHRSLAMPPRPRSWSPHTLSTLMHAAQLPSSIIISHQHRAVMWNDASVINHGHVHVYMHTTKQGHRHFFCKSAKCNAFVPRAGTRIKWNYLKIIGLHRTTKKSHLLRDGITNESLHKFIWSQSNPTHWKKTRSEN